MSSPLQRLIASGVMVTLHRSDPGKRGLNPIARSRVIIPAATFAGDPAQNVQAVEVEGTATGTATHAAVWIDREVWWHGPLRDRVEVTRGGVVTFPRGTLKMGR